VIGGATYFSGPIVGAFVFLYIRWGISRFPTLEAYWELFFGALLIGVVLYFKQGPSADSCCSAIDCSETAEGR